MTDLKMCRQLKTIEEGFTHHDLMSWVPIEPQPCCRNCRNWCYIADVIRHEEDGEERLKRFFCSEWEAKK